MEKEQRKENEGADAPPPAITAFQSLQSSALSDQQLNALISEHKKPPHNDKALCTPPVPPEGSNSTSEAVSLKVLEESPHAKEVPGRVKQKNKQRHQRKMKRNKEATPTQLALGVLGSVLRLLELAKSGNRAGCLSTIDKMQPSDLNEVLPLSIGGEENTTFLLRAVQLREHEVVAALLRAGASCAIRTAPCAAAPRGRDAWSEACSQGDMRLLELLEPHVCPVSHPLALYELLGTCRELSRTNLNGTMHEATSAFIQQQQKKLLKKKRHGTPVDLPVPPPPPVEMLSREEQEHQQAGWREMVAGMLRRHGKAWVEASGVALASVPVAEEPPSVLHRAVAMFTPGSLLQELLLHGFDGDLHKLDNQGFTPLQLVEHQMGVANLLLRRQVQNRLRSSGSARSDDDISDDDEEDSSDSGSEEEVNEETINSYSSATGSDSERSGNDSDSRGHWRSFISSSSDASSDETSGSSSGSSNDYDSSDYDRDDGNDDDDDDDDLGGGCGDRRMRGESEVGDWAYLDEAFLLGLGSGGEAVTDVSGTSGFVSGAEDGSGGYEKTSGSDNSRRLLHYMSDMLLVLVEASGVATTFSPKLGLTSTLARRVVLQRRSVFALLDTLCEAAGTTAGGDGDEVAFMLSSWQPASSRRAACVSSSSPGVSIGRRGAHLNSAVGGAGVASMAERSTADFGQYMDPGFHHDEDEVYLTPAITIVEEAARLYSSKLVFPCDVGASGEHDAGSLYAGRYSGRLRSSRGREPLDTGSNSGEPWLRWFLQTAEDSGLFVAPSDTSLRCATWVLCCAHYRVRDRHVRTWAHILQDLSAVLHRQGSNAVPPSSADSQFATMRDTRRSGDVQLLQTAGGDGVTEFCFSAPIIMDVAADPLPGLAHPGVAAAVLNRLGDTGFTLLYHLTGQVVSDDGDVVPHYEEEHFDSLLELFLCVVAPRLGVYHKQLLADDYDEVVAATDETSGKGARRKNAKAARRRQKATKKGSKCSHTKSCEEMDGEISIKKVQRSTATAEVPVPVSVPLEQSSFYRTSIGPTSAAHLLGAGRLLLPHELTQPPSPPVLPTRGRKIPSPPISDTVNASLLRFVTESVKPELLTLWHAVDNMLSLIATTVDYADRLAALVRGMFVWMTVDEATVTFPPIESGGAGSTHILLGSFKQHAHRNPKRKEKKDVQEKRGGLDKEKEGGGIMVSSLAAHWHPWSVVAAASSQQVNLSQLYRKHQLKALRRHGDSSAVKFLVASQTQQSMQQMLVENLNAKHGLHGVQSLPQPKLVSQAVPERFLAVCRMRGEGLSCLLDSDSRDPRENLLSTHLGFLLRVPWVLKDQQRMDVALNTLHDGVQDRERLRERDRVRGRAAEDHLGPTFNPFRDIEIHLNRFTEPPVWAESVLQQLQLVVKAPLSVGESLRSSNNLYRSELSVLYQGEAGMGPGPIKELLEMCRLTLLQVHQISATSLQEDLSQIPTPAKESGEPTKLHDAKVSAIKSADKKRSGRRNGGRKNAGVSQLPLHSIFPLFRPAGDSYPEAVVPLEVDAVVRKMLLALPAASLTAANRDRQEAQARHIALSLFESVGVVLGFSIRNSCPMGLGMPPFIWRMLLQQASWSTDDSYLSKRREDGKTPVSNDSKTSLYSTETSRSGGHHAGRGGASWQRQEQQEQVSWEELVGLDETMLRSLQDVLTLPAEDLAALELDFVGAETEWDAVAGRLELAEVPLLTGSAAGKARKSLSKPVHNEPQGENPPAVTTENRQQYVKLYARRRYCPPSMRSSVQALRRGLLRVIPQELIDIMSGPHIGEYLMGDVAMDLADMRMMVQYEGADYNEQHRVIKLFWRMLEQDFSELERRALLLFWTGSSVPPRGGFSVDAEYDEMTISKLSSARGSDHKRKAARGCALLPEASTCDKHLFLPEYASADEMRRAIRSALKHSSMGFDKP